MDKPSSLRDTLTKALPALKKDPQKLAIFVTGGRVIHTGTDSLSFEYAYTLRALLLDYNGHADAVMAPVVWWMKRNQPEVFDDPAKRAGERGPDLALLLRREQVEQAVDRLGRVDRVHRRDHEVSGLGRLDRREG